MTYFPAVMCIWSAAAGVRYAGMLHLMRFDADEYPVSARGNCAAAGFSALLTEAQPV
jgi:hypothetical protein